MKVYHKSSCITCQRGIKELERINKDFEKRDFFKEPLSETELTKLFKISKQKPSECLRKRDKKYKELKFDSKKRSETEIVKLMAKHPGLILRPIVISENQVFFGKIKIEDFQ